jgi:hypothetical protein
LFRDLFRVRLLFCLNLVLTIILAAAAQAQAQPGSGTAEAADTASKTDAPSPSQHVVLKVGDLQITQATFEQYLADLEAQQGPPELGRKKLGENYASMLMLSQMAAANHLDASPEVQRQLAIDRMQILSNAQFAKLKESASPTREEISAYYNAHLADYDTVEVRRIFVWSGDKVTDKRSLTPEEAQKMAEQIRQAYTSGGDVDRVISQTPHGSDDVMADKEPLKFQRGDLPGQMNDVVFALNEGGWKEFNNGPGAFAFFHVVKKGRLSLKDVTPQIDKKLQAQKLREQLESLKKQNGVWMDETYFVSKPEMPKFADRD